MAPGLGIGIFDSGSGGMVAAGFVSRLLEEADLPALTVFFGDTAHLPYGVRQEQETSRGPCGEGATHQHPAAGLLRLLG